MRVRRDELKEAGDRARRLADDKNLASAEVFYAVVTYQEVVDEFVAALEARVEVELDLRKAAYERIAALEARLAEATELCDDMFTSIENLAQIANLSGAVEEILTQFGYPLNHNLAHFAERRAALPPESAEG